MGEALSLRELGPSGWCRAALCVCLAAVALQAGCAPPAAPLPAVPPGVAPSPNIERLAGLEAALGRAGVPPDSVAAVAMRAAGLTPPFDRRHVLDAAWGRLAAGFITGGYPVFRDSLVVAVALGPAAGAALLEAARLIAERAAYQAGPARTVLVALPISSSGVETDATTAVTRTLAVPLWYSALVSRVVVIGPGAATAAGAIAQRNLTMTVVSYVPGTPTSNLALRAYTALTEAAAASSDTVAASR